MVRFSKKYFFVIILLFFFVNIFILVTINDSSLLPFLSGYRRAQKIRLLKHLYDSNAFLADIRALRRLHNKTLRHIDSVLLSKKHLAFGIFDNEHDFSKLTNKYDLESLGAAVYISNGYVGNETKPTHIYVLHAEYKLQVSIFYKRGEFYWIGNDNQKSNIAIGPFEVHYEIDTKWFGDVPRAIQNFVVQTVVDHEGIYQLPINIAKFLYEYRYSRFIECNRTLLEENTRALNGNFSQNLELNSRMMPVLKQITSKFENNLIRYWLSGGTLLGMLEYFEGWYRDCGLIPHTTDADLYIPHSDYKDYVVQSFRGDVQAPLYKIMGLKNDSREIRILLKKTQVDVFVVYVYNSTHQTVGFHSNREKLRRWVPRFDGFCSGEMLGVKFMVPCDPELQFNFEYGTREAWSVPKRKDYRSLSLDRQAIVWTDDVWPHVLKYYLPNGDFNTKRTEFFLKKFATKELPPIEEIQKDL